jgi:hypothetical protein
MVEHRRGEGHLAGLRVDPVSISRQAATGKLSCPSRRRGAQRRNAEAARSFNRRRDPRSVLPLGSELGFVKSTPQNIIADGTDWRFLNPITFLAGVHVGCFELFGNESIRSIADLKGKSVGVPGLGSDQHVFLTAMAAHVGLDPNRDIH